MQNEAADLAAAEAEGSEQALQARMMRTCCVDSLPEAQRVARLLQRHRALRDPLTREPLVFGCDTEVRDCLAS